MKIDLEKLDKELDEHKLACVRCNHKWLPRKPVVMTCPNCRSPYWNTPKKAAEDDEEGGGG